MLEWQERQRLKLCSRCDEPRVPDHFLCADHDAIEALRHADWLEKLHRERWMRDTALENRARQIRSYTASDRYDVAAEQAERFEDQRQARLSRGAATDSGYGDDEGDAVGSMSPEERRER